MQHRYRRKALTWCLALAVILVTPGVAVAGGDKADPEEIAVTEPESAVAEHEITEVSTLVRGPEAEDEEHIAHTAPDLEPSDDRDTPDSTHRIDDGSVREEQRADRDRDGGEESRDREQWGRDRSHHDNRGEGEGRRAFPEEDGDDEEEPHEDRWSDDDEWASEDDSWSDDERHDRD